MPEGPRKSESLKAQQENSTVPKDVRPPNYSSEIAGTVPKRAQSFARVISIVAMLLAIGSFIGAFTLQQRGLPDDPLAALACGVMGSIFLIGGVAGLQSTPSNSTGHTRKASLGIRVSNGIMRSLALLLGAISLSGGIACIGMAALIFNQEYLGWFISSRSFHSSRGSPAELLAEFHTLGIGFTAMGVFLIWYAVWPLSLTQILRHIGHTHRFRSTDAHSAE